LYARILLLYNIHVTPPWVLGLGINLIYLKRCRLSIQLTWVAGLS
jgi:hypothetical protein